MLAFSIIAGLHARLLAADPCGAHPTVEPAECGQDHPCDSGHSHDTPSDDGDRQPHPSGHHHEGCFHAMPLMTDPPVSHSARCWPISHYKPRRPRWSRSRTCVTSSGKTTPGITSAQLPSGDRPTRRPAMVGEPCPRLLQFITSQAQGRYRLVPQNLHHRHLRRGKETPKREPWLNRSQSSDATPRWCQAGGSLSSSNHRT